MQRRNCPQGSAALSLASLRGSASAFAFVQKAAAPDWEKRGFVVQLFLGRLSPSPDWKPTAGVCFEIIYQPAIKSPGGFPTPHHCGMFFPHLFLFFFGNSEFLQNILTGTAVGPKKKYRGSGLKVRRGHADRILNGSFFILKASPHLRSRVKAVT